MAEGMPVAIDRVRFWMNAFVPHDVSGLTVRLPAGPHAGKTALEGRTRLLTDQRAFSRDPAATSRMHTLVTIALEGPEPVVTVTHRADWAVSCDREHGEITCRARASTRLMTASVLSLAPVTVRLDCATRHPCSDVPTALVETGFRGTVVYRPDERELSVDMFVASFPAFEAYGALNDSTPAILFHHAPPAGIVFSPVAARVLRRLRSAIDDRHGTGRF